MNAATNSPGTGLGGAGDDFYQALMQAHDGLSDDESVRLNARLVLLLANEIGDLKTLTDLLFSARNATR